MNILLDCISSCLSYLQNTLEKPKVTRRSQLHAKGKARYTIPATCFKHEKKRGEKSIRLDSYETEAQHADIQLIAVLLEELEKEHEFL